MYTGRVNVWRWFQSAIKHTDFSDCSYSSFASYGSGQNQWRGLASNVWERCFLFAVSWLTLINKQFFLLVKTLHSMYLYKKDIQHTYNDIQRGQKENRRLNNTWRYDSVKWFLLLYFIHIYFYVVHSCGFYCCLCCIFQPQPWRKANAKRALLLRRSLRLSSRQENTTVSSKYLCSFLCRRTSVTFMAAWCCYIKYPAT